MDRKEERETRQKRRHGGKLRGPTSAGVVLHQELIQGHPATTHAHHHRAAQDSDQAQFLRVSKLQQRADIECTKLQFLMKRLFCNNCHAVML